MRLAVGLLAFAVVMVAGAVVAGDARAAPCAPGKATVRPHELKSKLTETVDAHGELTGYRGTWGTCKVRRGIARERDGTKVAALFCGVMIYVPGIVDGFGVSVGMTGEKVLELRGDGPSSTLMCAHYFEPKVNRTRCFIPPPRDFPEESVWAYDVRGRIADSAKDEDGFVRGEKALAFFRTRRVAEMFNRGMCH